MNTIKEYVESMFVQVPRTEETEQLKADILANMEDKYEELRAGGASENEAIGAVITEFGNIDEVLEEMDLKRDPELEDLEDVKIVETDEAFEYVEAKRRAGLGIGLGVLSIIAGVGSLLIFVGMLYSSNASFLLGIGLTSLLIFAAIGISLFIVHGMRLSDYKDFTDWFVLVPEARREIEEAHNAYKRSHTLSIVLGVVLCVLSVIPILLGVFIGERVWYILAGVGIGLVIAGAGCFFFIYNGNIWDGYHKLLENGKTFEDLYENKQQLLREKKVHHFLDEIYWPLIVIVYLLWSVFYTSWAISWVIWPVAGIVYSIILMVFDIEDK